MTGVRIGEVTHFFDRINVAAIQLSQSLHKGDQVHFLGHGSDFIQEVTSIQIEHETVESASAGKEIAIRVTKTVKPHTSVFLITEE